MPESLWTSKVILSMDKVNMKWIPKSQDTWAKNLLKHEDGRLRSNKRNVILQDQKRTHVIYFPQEMLHNNKYSLKEIIFKCYLCNHKKGDSEQKVAFFSVHQNNFLLKKKDEEREGEGSAVQWRTPVIDMTWIIQNRI